eukprot:397214-Prymnesium_polylepis.1
MAQHVAARRRVARRVWGGACGAVRVGQCVGRRMARCVLRGARVLRVCCAHVFVAVAIERRLQPQPVPQ